MKQEKVIYCALYVCVLLACVCGLQSCKKRPGGGENPDGPVAISFSGAKMGAESVLMGGTGSNVAAREDAVCGVAGRQDVAYRNNDKGLEEELIYNFKLFGYKNMSLEGGNYGGLETVFPCYDVNWVVNTAGTTTTNTVDWDYVGIANSALVGEIQTIKYWDFGAEAYRFFGFAPGNGLAWGVTANYTYPANHGDGYTWFDFTFPADATNPEGAPYISKLWFSNGDDAAYPNQRYGEVVRLEFLKPVTKVRIVLYDMNGDKIENPSGMGVTKLEFAPTGGGKIVQKGNLKVSYPLTGPATITHYLPSVEIEGDPTGTVQIDETGEDYDEWYLVLPHITQTAYQLHAVIGGKDKIATVPAHYMSWAPNMEYTYRFKLTDAEFQFIDIVQIGVTEWQVENVNHDVYNW